MHDICKVILNTTLLLLLFYKYQSQRLQTFTEYFYKHFLSVLLFSKNTAQKLVLIMGIWSFQSNVKHTLLFNKNFCYTTKSTIFININRSTRPRLHLNRFPRANSNSNTLVSSWIDEYCNIFHSSLYGCISPDLGVSNFIFYCVSFHI